MRVISSRSMENGDNIESTIEMNLLTERPLYVKLRVKLDFLEDFMIFLYWVRIFIFSKFSKGSFQKTKNAAVINFEALAPWVPFS